MNNITKQPKVVHAFAILVSLPNDDRFTNYFLTYISYPTHTFNTLHPYKTIFSNQTKNNTGFWISVVIIKFLFFSNLKSHQVFHLGISLKLTNRIV